MPVDYAGRNVPDTEKEYILAIQIINGARRLIWARNPNYRPPDAPAYSGPPTVVNPPVPPTVEPSPAKEPTHQQFTFDTIGQTINRCIGHCRMPLKIIWAEGINASGDILTASTLTFAAALGAPLDELEEGAVGGIWNGGDLIFDPNQGGTIIPAHLDPSTGAILAASLASMILYPGNETQDPEPLIIADKGADRTPAFRGLRYIIFQDFPLSIFGLTNMSVLWIRDNAMDDHFPMPEPPTTGHPPGSEPVVEFLAA